MVFFGIGFKEIVLIFLGYLLVRFIIGVRRARKTVLEMKKQMETEMNEAQRSANRRPEGEIRIDKGINPKKKGSNDSDEYVDFEEID
jgi:hypothetical protein